MKIVLDTNVLIAAFIARRGMCSSLLEHCVHQHKIVGSNFILGELKEKLLAKFGLGEDDIAEILNVLEPHMEVVEPVPLAAAICRDPEDDVIIATALSGVADCIVTGDKDLLILKQVGDIRILSPSEFTDFEQQQSMSSNR